MEVLLNYTLNNTCHIERFSAVLTYEKKRKDYAFWRQFTEKPSIIPGCPFCLDLFSCLAAEGSMH